MTLPRSAGDVLSDHVTFELESIDRLYCNLYVPQLQRAEGIVGFIRGHLGRPIASTAVIAPMSRDFIARLAAFAGAHDIPRVDFARGQRKDDVMHQHLAAFQAAGRTEGVLFIGRAQEKNTVFRTEKRRAADGSSYPWIVRTTSVVNQGANSLIIAVFGEEEQSGDCCEHALELVDRAAVAAAFPAEHPPCLHLCHGVLDGGADLAEDRVEFTLPVQELRSAEALERHDPDAVDSDVAEVGASIS